ncbi:hypothetical protein XA68_10289 [Ophiocordyceps unilateralis]|uniref:Uncharacterized protein n=1 Tax=Ophiocordyceps unilateralis TaxID=268505 RepID=A0A2A9PHL0_OPHUN|nr:hypothetical protein XA68_10289 [Ophiocordyceps unilateralis]
MGINRRRPPLLLLLLLLLVAAATSAFANVEKIIFPGPPTANIPSAKPSLADLALDTLTPQRSALRTNLSRVFAAAEGLASRGQSSWLLLNDLAEGQRYELRVCWAAVEPTSFALDVYQLDHVWRTPELIQSLAEYASKRHDLMGNTVTAQARQPSPQSIERKSSVLLLHIRAAADYFTDDEQLMKHPPPVLVDLILDPFLYNVIPLSLVPTAGYLVLVSVITWFLAQWIASSLESVARSPEGHAKKHD